MTPPDKNVAINRLKSALDLIPHLTDLDLSDAKFIEWRRDTGIAVGYAFGEPSKEVDEFHKIRFMPIVYSAEGMRRAYVAGLSTSGAVLRSMIRQVENRINEARHLPAAEVGQPITNPGDVFIVHGRDEGAKDTVSRFVERIGLKPIVLMEMPSKGNTIIEKFEAHADVGYAIVLLTADDSGALHGEDPRPRARQNVIFELGFFTGKLGRKYVCALTKGDPEVPSDYAGVVYIPMDGASDWQMPLIQELKAAGLDVDANKAFI